MQYRVHLNSRQILNRVFPNIFGDNGGTCSEVYVELEVGKEYTPLKVSDFYFQWLPLIGRYSIIINNFTRFFHYSIFYEEISSGTI